MRKVPRISSSHDLIPQANLGSSQRETWPLDPKTLGHEAGRSTIPVPFHHCRQCSSTYDGICESRPHGFPPPWRFFALSYNSICWWHTHYSKGIMADPNEIIHLKRSLSLSQMPLVTYELWKSSFVPIHADDDQAASLTNTLGCEISYFPLPYLVLPLSLRKLYLSAFHPLISKEGRRLVGWCG